MDKLIKPYTIKLSKTYTNRNIYNYLLLYVSITSMQHLFCYTPLIETISSVNILSVFSKPKSIR